MDQELFVKCINKSLKNFGFKNIGKSRNNLMSIVADKGISIIVGLQKSRFNINLYYIELGISFLELHMDELPEKYYMADVRTRLKVFNTNTKVPEDFYFENWSEEFVNHLIIQIYNKQILPYIREGKNFILSEYKNGNLFEVSQAAKKYLNISIPERNLPEISDLIKSDGMICIKDESYQKDKAYYDEVKKQGGKVCIMNGKKAYIL